MNNKQELHLRYTQYLAGFSPEEKSRVVEKGVRYAHGFLKLQLGANINSWSSISNSLRHTHDYVVFIAENDKAVDKWSSIRNRRIIV